MRSRRRLDRVLRILRWREDAQSVDMTLTQAALVPTELWDRAQGLWLTPAVAPEKSSASQLIPKAPDGTFPKEGSVFSATPSAAEGSLPMKPNNPPLALSVSPRHLIGVVSTRQSRGFATTSSCSLNFPWLPFQLHHPTRSPPLQPEPTQPYLFRPQPSPALSTGLSHWCRLRKAREDRNC